MAITIQADQFDDPPTISDSGGLFMAGTRTFMGLLTGTDVTSDVRQLVSVLNHSDVPECGDAIHASNSQLSNMVCVSREATAVGPAQVQVTCSYRYIDSSLNAAQIIRPITGLKVQTTDKTPDGTEIRVTHEGVDQLAEVSALHLDDGMRIEVMVQTNLPSALSYEWIAHVNDLEWFGISKGCALCTAADFKPLNLLSNPRRYIFDFEFKFDDRGWAPEASWRMFHTGRSVPGMATETSLTEVSGRKKIMSFYPPKSFHTDP